MRWIRCISSLLFGNIFCLCTMYSHTLVCIKEASIDIAVSASATVVLSYWYMLWKDGVVPSAINHINPKKNILAPFGRCRRH